MLLHSTPEKQLEYNAGTTEIMIGSFSRPGMIEVESHALEKVIVQRQVQYPAGAEAGAPSTHEARPRRTEPSALSVWGRETDPGTGTSQVVVRSPLANLDTLAPRRGLVAVVSVLFGTIVFDSFRYSCPELKLAQGDVTSRGAWRRRSCRSSPGTSSPTTSATGIGFTAGGLYLLFAAWPPRPAAGHALDDDGGAGLAPTSTSRRSVPSTAMVRVACLRCRRTS